MHWPYPWHLFTSPRRLHLHSHWLPCIWTSWIRHQLWISIVSIFQRTSGIPSVAKCFKLMIQTDVMIFCTQFFQYTHLPFLSDSILDIISNLYQTIKKTTSTNDHDTLSSRHIYSSRIDIQQLYAFTILAIFPYFWAHGIGEDLLKLVR